MSQPQDDLQHPAPNVEFDSIAEDASYEQLAELLQRQVALLERGELSLAQSLAAYERGVALVRRCGQLLDNAQLRISTLSANAENNMTEQHTAGEDSDDQWDSPDDLPF